MKPVPNDDQPTPSAQLDPPTPAGGSAVQTVRTELRDAILRGDLRPGDAVTSVQVAETFGVSRTPAREALRMLQEEGFLRGELNRRLRVVEWSPEELEAVFAERILLTVLCTRVTIPTLTNADIDDMEALLGDMETARVAGAHDAWRVADIAFHGMHLKGASPTLRADLARLYERASMFRAIWLRSRDQSLSFNMEDHPAILEACRRRDADAGGVAAALHLTRVALTLMGQLAPDREPAAVRQALRLTGRQPADDNKIKPEARLRETNVTAPPPDVGSAGSTEDVSVTGNVVRTLKPHVQRRKR